MNVLAIGAHYDDIELGCSGTLMKHVANGDKVTIVVITDSAYEDPRGEEVRSAQDALREGQDAAAIMGVEMVCLNFKTFLVPYAESLSKILTEYIEDLQIDIMYSPWTGDLHRDHKYAGRCAIMAGRHVPNFLMYRCNFYDTDEHFRGNFYSDISDFMEKKLQVIKAHKSELQRVRYSWLNFFKNEHRNSGQKIGVKYAECFQIVRYLV
jgi:N-acetylglucosamine malate deacetylase 1